MSGNYYIDLLLWGGMAAITWGIAGLILMFILDIWRSS